VGYRARRWVASLPHAWMNRFARRAHTTRARRTVPQNLIDAVLRGLIARPIEFGAFLESTNHALSSRVALSVKFVVLRSKEALEGENQASSTQLVPKRRRRAFGDAKRLWSHGKTSMVEARDCEARIPRLKAWDCQLYPDRFLVRHTGFWRCGTPRLLVRGVRFNVWPLGGQNLGNTLHPCYTDKTTRGWWAVQGCSVEHVGCLEGDIQDGPEQEVIRAVLVSAVRLEGVGGQRFILEAQSVL
jgi:hypothetical protein